MKRSEALDIIDDVLYEHECPLLQGISKEILGRLEKAGMQPPKVNQLIEIFELDSTTNTTKFVKSMRDVVMHSEWEEE